MLHRKEGLYWACVDCGGDRLGVEEARNGECVAVCLVLRDKPIVTESVAGGSTKYRAVHAKQSISSLSRGKHAVQPVE